MRRRSPRPPCGSVPGPLQKILPGETQPAPRKPRTEKSYNRDRERVGCLPGSDSKNPLLCLGVSVPELFPNDLENPAAQGQMLQPGGRRSQRRTKDLAVLRCSCFPRLPNILAGALGPRDYLEAAVNISPVEHFTRSAAGLTQPLIR